MRVTLPRLRTLPIVVAESAFALPSAPLAQTAPVAGDEARAMAAA